MKVDIRQNKSDRLWKLSENLTDICILGALCLLCSLPIVTIGAAASAMYTVFMSHITHGRKELVKPFFSAFKNNLKNCTIIWLIMLPLMILFTVDSLYYLYLPGRAFHLVMGIIMLCLLAIATAIFCYALAAIALHNSRVKDTLIKATRCCFKSWPWTLLVIAVNLAVVALLAVGLWYFIFLFIGIAGYTNSRIMIKAFN